MIVNGVIKKMVLTINDNFNNMKHLVFLILFVGVLTEEAHAQKTTRETVSSVKGVTIIRAVTENADGTKEVLFYMSGQNDQYSHINDVLEIKSGTAAELNELLTQCMKFLPEKAGTSVEYEGNTIGATGRNQVVLFGSGQDSRGNVLLNHASITKLQQDLRKYL